MWLHMWEGKTSSKWGFSSKPYALPTRTWPLELSLNPGILQECFRCQSSQELKIAFTMILAKLSKWPSFFKCSWITPLGVPLRVQQTKSQGVMLMCLLVSSTMILVVRHLLTSVVSIVMTATSRRLIHWYICKINLNTLRCIEMNIYTHKFCYLNSGTQANMSGLYSWKSILKQAFVVR